MRFFRRWFGTRPDTRNDAELPIDVLDRFVVASLAPVNRIELDRDPLQQQHVMAYFFGAAQRLAQADDLDETHTLALMVMFLNRYFSASVSEIGSVTTLRRKFEDSTEGRALMREGEEMLQRWLASNDPAALRRLQELLASS